MDGNKTPLLVGLVVLIVAAVGLIIYQARGRNNLSEAQRNAIGARQQGPPGSFTPAPR
jgi:hypothetical protein